MYIDPITSVQNPKIKDLTVLQSKSKERRTRGLFVVEGKREFERSILGGYIAENIFFCENYISVSEIEKLLEHSTNPPGSIYSVSKQVYEKIAYRESSEGIVAVLHEKRHTLDDIVLSDNPLVLVLESVEKPGNLGAVLRTADAAGIDAVIICDPLTDVYNPNLIRASVGGVFTVQTAVCTSLEALHWLNSRNISIYTAQLQDSELYYDTDMASPTAIVFGTEDTGLSQLWREHSDRRIRIPMSGILDSLNVSVSAAILCFEAVRQRNSK
ncbi:MAG: RNA methyltransferase [Bacteroidales bacterium]|nr:RNA methyltransferase [Bacteroidales bacterium]MDD4670329.1 RNA methyltransferase [Bacteroidales bacterium]